MYNLGDNPTDTPLFPDQPRDRARPSREERAEGAAADGQRRRSGNKPRRRANRRPQPGSFHRMPNSPPPANSPFPCSKASSAAKNALLEAVNVPNAGYVPGLPNGAVVEVPATANHSGLHPIATPPLPEPILALLRTQTSINRLLVDAFRQRSRHTLLQALLLDPTTGSYRQAVGLVNEMFRLQAGRAAGDGLVGFPRAPAHPHARPHHLHHPARTVPRALGVGPRIESGGRQVLGPVERQLSVAPEVPRGLRQPLQLARSSSFGSRSRSASRIPETSWIRGGSIPQERNSPFRRQLDDLL